MQSFSVTGADSASAILYRSTRSSSQKRGLRPILIEADAIAVGARCHPLILSPGHNFFLDGLLVPTGWLVNGRTVREREHRGSTFEYYSVVREDYAVIFARNLAVESWHAYDAHDQVDWDNFAASRARNPATLDRLTARCASRVGGRRQRLSEQFLSSADLRWPPANRVALLRRRIGLRV